MAILQTTNSKNKRGATNVVVVGREPDETSSCSSTCSSTVCGTLITALVDIERMRRSFSNFQVVKNFVAAPTASLKPKTLRMAEQLVEGNRTALSRAITLIESTREKDKEQAEALLDHALALRRSQSSSDIKNRDHVTGFRLGIAGPPGAGKSTFVEALGGYLTDLGVSPCEHARKYIDPCACTHTLFA